MVPRRQGSVWVRLLIRLRAQRRAIGADLLRTIRILRLCIGIQRRHIPCLGLRARRDPILASMFSIQTLDVLIAIDLRV